jgi:hypothetical protein
MLDATAAVKAHRQQSASPRRLEELFPKDGFARVILDI